MPGLVNPTERLSVTLQGEGEMAVNALYASLFASGVDQLELSGLPNSHRSGPDYLNVLRFLDIPQALAMAAERSSVKLIIPQGDNWEFPRAAQHRLGWPENRLQIQRQ